MAPRILTAGEAFALVADDTTVEAVLGVDQCDEGPCGDDPDCPCNERGKTDE